MTQLESKRGLDELEQGLRLLFQKKYAEAAAVFEAMTGLEGVEPVLRQTARRNLAICKRMTAPVLPVPGTINELIDLMIFHLNRHEHDQVQKLLEKGRQLKPDCPDLHLVEAHLLCARQEYEPAVKALRKYSEKAPGGKARAINDPDFEPLWQLDSFQSLC